MAYTEHGDGVIVRWIKIRIKSNLKMYLQTINANIDDYTPYR